MRHKRPRLWRIIRVRTRRFMSRLERTTPLWALGLAPWGTSIALHAVVLLLLGVYFYVYVGRERDDGPDLDTAFAGQLIDDLTSLSKADQAGDPFTTLKTAEPPSLSLEAAPADTTKINVPELPKSIHLGADLRPTGSEVVRDIGKTAEGVALGVRVGPASAPFSGRQGEAKAKLVRREGGTVESEKAVERGLDWIARHQKADGSWSLDTRGECREVGCPDDVAAISDTAATGLALLPMLGAGMTHTEPGRYQDSLKRGLSWLIKHQRPTGDLFTEGNNIAHMYSHAIGTMALCEAYGVTHDKRLRDPAQKAINFIVNSQNKFDGGWRYEPGAVGDTSVFGWQIFALRSANLAGLTVSAATLRRCNTYLDGATADEYKTTYSYMAGRQATPVMTAEALLCRQILGWKRDYPPMLKGAGLVSAHLTASQDRNIYYWYYATQLLHNLQGKDWDRWNVRVRDGLISMQVGGKGCDRGSWNPVDPQPDEWGKSVGRLYLTSLSLLTLEVYYRYLPLYRARDGKLEGTEEPTAKAAPGADPAATGATPAAAGGDPAAPAAGPAAAAAKPAMSAEDPAKGKPGN
jgi:Prenyltransferase and squalene oxidase repeat